MELLQLRYFVTVAKMQSITKAANYYGIPQPAMSQTIARLEADLGGIRLFDRKNSRIYLNETPFPVRFTFWFWKTAALS